MDPIITDLTNRWHDAVIDIKEGQMAFYDTEYEEREHLPSVEDYYAVLIKEIAEVPNKKYDPENDSKDYEFKLWWKGEIYEGEHKGLWVNAQTTKVGGEKSRIFGFAKGYEAGTDGKGKGGVKDPESYKEFEGYVVKACCVSNDANGKTYDNIERIVQILKTPAQVALESEGATEVKDLSDEPDVPF